MADAVRLASPWAATSAASTAPAAPTPLSLRKSRRTVPLSNIFFLLTRKSILKSPELMLRSPTTQLELFSQISKAGRRTIQLFPSGWKSPRRASRDSAIYEQCLAGYITAGLCRQEYNRRIQFLRLSRPLHGNAIAKILHPFLVFIQNFILLCTEPAWR